MDGIERQSWPINVFLVRRSLKYAVKTVWYSFEHFRNAWSCKLSTMYLYQNVSKN